MQKYFSFVKVIMSLPYVCTIKSEIGKHLINLIDDFNY